MGLGAVTGASARTAGARPRQATAAPYAAISANTGVRMVIVSRSSGQPLRIEIFAVDTASLRTQQIEERSGQRGGARQGVRILSGIGGGTHRGAHAAWIDG